MKELTANYIDWTRRDITLHKIITTRVYPLAMLSIYTKKAGYISSIGAVNTLIYPCRIIAMVVKKTG